MHTDRPDDAALVFKPKRDFLPVLTIASIVMVAPILAIMLIVAFAVGPLALAIVPVVWMLLGGGLALYGQASITYEVADSGLTIHYWWKEYSFQWAQLRRVLSDTRALQFTGFPTQSTSGPGWVNASTSPEFLVLEFATSDSKPTQVVISPRDRAQFRTAVQQRAPQASFEGF